MNPKPPSQDSTEPEAVELAAGRARVRLLIQAPPGTRVRVTLEAEDTPHGLAVQAQAAPDRPHVLSAAWEALAAGVRRASAWVQRAGAEKHLEFGLLGLTLAVYLLTRFIGLEQYPIYFFTDEAVQTVLAQDFLRDGLRGSDKILLPTYFLNSYQYNLSLSVYVQVLPYLLLGKAIWITRGVPALLSVLACLWVALTLRRVFHLPHAWAGALLLSITPAWFLHSRTAFETSLAVTFLAGFVYYYLRYRTGHPRALLLAALMGALTFYSYAPTRLAIGLAAVFLLLSDAAYHWQQRKWVGWAFLLTLLLALPLLRFQLAHPTENLNHLRVLNSYWIQPIPLSAKLGQFFSEYARGLNPLYWYLPNTVDLERHTMKGYGHLLRFTLPFLLVGLGAALWKIRSAPHRALLLVLLAAPSGAALVALGITRALVMVIPAALLSGLGLCLLLQWVEKRWRIPRTALAVLTFALLAGVNVYMLRDALVNGPLWFRDYGLGGMQYGAKQLTEAIDEYQNQNPGARLMVSPSWANGTDTILRFFYPEDLPYQMGSIEGYLYEIQPLDEQTVFVMIPQEFKMVNANPKFTDVRVEKTVPTPDGQTGFYFVRLRYADNIAEILESERQARQALRESEIRQGNLILPVRYSYLDMGEIAQLFDGDENSLVRTLEANPLRLHITMNEQIRISGVEARIGGTATEVTATLVDAAGQVLAQEQISAADDPNPRWVSLHFNQAYTPAALWLDIRSLNDGEPAHVHLWEVRWQE